jgi:hypothetical protein
MYSLDEFPDELLVKILKMISFKSQLSASLVSKRFHNIIFNDIINNKFKFSIRWNQINDDFNENNSNDNQMREFYLKGLTVLSQSYNNFSDLSLNSLNINFENSLELKLWKRSENSINCLQLNDCTITDIELLNLISNLDQLIELHLNNNHYFVKNQNSKRNYSSDLMSKVSKSLNNLRELDFSGEKSFKLCDALFVIIANECKSLEVLNVSKCKIIFHSAVIRRYYFDTEDYWKRATEYAFTFAILKTFLNKFGSNIKRLDFSQTNICFQHLYQLVSSQELTQLKEINIKNCVNISEQNIIDIKNFKTGIQFIYT